MKIVEINDYNDICNAIVGNKLCYAGYNENDLLSGIVLPEDQEISAEITSSDDPIIEMKKTTFTTTIVIPDRIVEGASADRITETSGASERIFEDPDDITP